MYETQEAAHSTITVCVLKKYIYICHQQQPRASCAPASLFLILIELCVLVFVSPVSSVPERGGLHVVVLETATAPRYPSPTSTSRPPPTLASRVYDLCVQRYLWCSSHPAVPCLLLPLSLFSVREMTSTDTDRTSLFVVLYQSCPRSVYIRHTALRSLCVLFFFYGFLTAFISCFASRRELSSFPALIINTVLDGVGLTLAVVSLVYRVTDEKARVRDGIERAGAAGDVQVQIARSRMANRQADRSPVESAAPPQLFMFEYDEQDYWCVQPCRDDGGEFPSPDVCARAADREMHRRTRDARIGKAYFAMAVVCSVVTLISTVFVLTLDALQRYRLSYELLTIPLEDRIAILSVACVVMTAAAITVPIRPGTGIDISCHVRAVPPGSASLRKSAGGVGHLVEADAAPRYQAALPGPPLDELEARERAECDGARLANDAPTADTWSLADQHSPAKARVAETEVSVNGDKRKTGGDAWVWGGFMRDDTPPPHTATPPAADGVGACASAACGPHGATAPAVGEDTSSDATHSRTESSSRFQGHL